MAEGPTHAKATVKLVSPVYLSVFPLLPRGSVSFTKPTHNTEREGGREEGGREGGRGEGKKGREREDIYFVLQYN